MDQFYDFMEREGVVNLYSGKHDSIKGRNCGLSYTPMDDPRQQRTTWTIDQGIEFLDAQDDRSFFLFLSVFNFLSSKLKITLLIYAPSNFEKSIKLLNVLQNIFNNSRRLFLIS